MEMLYWRSSVCVDDSFTISQLDCENCLSGMVYVQLDLGLSHDGWMRCSDTLPYSAFFNLFWCFFQADVMN